MKFSPEDQNSQHKDPRSTTDRAGELLPVLTWIGYRSSGKSTLTHALSQETGLHVTSTDELIFQAARLPLEKIIEQEGWDSFRRREATVLQKLLDQVDDLCQNKQGLSQGLIIDCGGGVVLHAALMKAFAQRTGVIYCAASLTTIMERLAERPRPRLTEQTSLLEETRDHLAIRTKLYEHYAHIVLDTSDEKTEKTKHQPDRYTDDRYAQTLVKLREHMNKHPRLAAIQSHFQKKKSQKQAI